MEIAELSGQAVPAIQVAKRGTTRANFWAIIAFCAMGADLRAPCPVILSSDRANVCLAR
ncbi:MAG: hypothetical protein WBE48_09005 [Xanthobacteraceae bacterium]|jgi:hypothetical protein